MSTHTIQKAYRIDEDLYEQAEHTLSKMGMSVPQAITMLFRRVVMEQKWPFTPAVVKSEDQIQTEQRIGAITATMPFKAPTLGDAGDLDEFYAE